MIRSFSLICIVILSLPVLAQTQPRQLETHRHWRSFVLDSTQGKICYIGSEPLESSPNMQSRDRTWVLVTHRPVENVKNEIGVITGYQYRLGTEVNVVIDTEKYVMFTQGDGAWLRNVEDEAKAVAAMKRGRRMTVVGYSNTGITTTDKYSLLGFTAAYRAISKECGV